MIRQATPEDNFDLLSLTREFTREAPEFYKFDHDKTSAYINYLHESDSDIILVVEDGDGIYGYLAATFAHHPFIGRSIAMDIGWFVTKEKRGGMGSMRLVKAFEDWAKLMEADYAVLGDINGVTDLAGLYARCGYALHERQFSKAV